MEAALLKSPSFSPNFSPGTAELQLQQSRDFFPAAAELKQPLPFPAAAMGQGHSANCTGGMGSRRNPQLFIPAQCSKLGHCSGGIKIPSNAPKTQPSVILSPTEQWCHTRINPGRFRVRFESLKYLIYNTPISL